MSGDFRHIQAGFFEVDFFRTFAGTIGEGLLVAENDFLNVLGPSTHRLTESALQHVDDALGEIGARWQGVKVIAGIARLDSS